MIERVAAGDFYILYRDNVPRRIGDRCIVKDRPALLRWLPKYADSRADSWKNIGCASASSFTRAGGTPGSRIAHRHSPGTLGTCFSGAPDTIRTCDPCLRGLAPYPLSPFRDIAEAGSIG